MSECSSDVNELRLINKSTAWIVWHKDCEGIKDNRIHYQAEKWPEMQHNRNYGHYDNYNININYCKPMTVVTTDKLCDCRWSGFPRVLRDTGESFYRMVCLIKN